MYQQILYGYWQQCSTCGGNGVNNGFTCWACAGVGGRYVKPYQPNPWVPFPNPHRPQRWVPKCTCGQTTICPVHPTRSENSNTF